MYFFAYVMKELVILRLKFAALSALRYGLSGTETTGRASTAVDTIFSLMTFIVSSHAS